MADVNANIDINIDSSNALAQLKALQRQISQFHTSISKSSEAAALAQRGLQKNLLNSVNAIGSFTAEMRTVKTSTESFTNSLEKNKFSMREYFRYAGASTKTFGRLFKSEFDTIGKVSEERVKRLQTQYIKMGRDTNGAMQAMAVMPTKLNLDDYTTQVQIAAQKQALFNQLMKQGSTNLLNFGKNTQWAGRQLMVGFTLPLMAVGSAASKTFMEMEAQALKFKKVYGDLFTPQEETQQALDNITELGKQFTRYGVAVSTTVGLAAEAAAAGFSGLDLQRQTTEATRLSILGQVDSQKALETTISLQNAFGMSSEKLADSINFLNAVENQTVVSLDDITTAIPKVAPVIQQLGGDVKDLAFFMAAMKEGGINASEGANALKSGLAALINPTKKASDMLAGFGINATAIIEKNKGNLKATVIEFANALNSLDPLTRARAIEQLFGKFQFARLSTLFANVTKEGNQAARVLGLANSTVEELATLSEKELGMTAESSMNKFKKTVEDLKAALIPVGQAFLESVTPIVEFVGNILEKFANLSSGTKRFITLLTVGVGAIGPVLLMTFGLLANGVANIIKLFLTLRGGYQRLTGQTQILGEQTQYMTMEQLDAAAAAHSLNQTHATLTQTFTAERTAINQLIAAYNSAAGAARNFATTNPGMMLPGRGAKKLANGIVSVPGPKGAGDIVPAMLSPGEAVIPAKFVKKYGPLIQGMVAGNIPGYERGVGSVPGSLFGTSATFSRANTGPRIEQVINQLDAIVKDLVVDAVPDIIESLKGASISVESFGKELQKRIEAGSINVPKSALGGFGEKSYSAPAAIKKQTAAMDWQSRQKEEDAITEALKEYKLTLEQRNNIIGKDTAHIEQSLATGPTGEKIWDPSNLQADSRAINKYMEQAKGRMLKFASETEKVDTLVADVAQQLKMSSQAIKERFARLARGNQPQTTADYALVSGFAAQDVNDPKNKTPYMAAAAGAVANVRVSDPSYVEALAKGDVTAYRKVVEKQSRQVVGATISATAKAAGTNSPSRKTIPIGEDIARGLEVGMSNRQDDVALAGSKVGKSAVGGVQGGARNIPFRAPGQPGSVAANVPSPGLSLSEITEKARRNREQLISAQQLKRTQAMNARMNSLNKAFMSGTFAISALSGMASLAGGNLGKFSEILFQISGPLFALSSVIQLLTGQKVVSVLAGLGALKIGLIAAGITALGVGFKLTNDARQRELQYINGLSDAMKTTTSQVKTLGDFFGVVPTKLPFEGRNREVVGKQTRSARDTLRANESFQKEFAGTIKTLSTATAQEAQLAFTSLALNLKAQGFAQEQVQTIIDALREEAGRTDVKLDVKSLNFSPESIKGLQDQIAGLLVTFSREFQTAPTGLQKFLKGFWGSLFGETPEVVTMTDATKKSLSELSTFVVEVSNSAAGMFRLGIISGEQFESSLMATVETMQGLDEVSRRVALLEIFKKLDVNAEPFLANLKTAKQQMMMIALLSAGVLGKDSEIMADLSAKGSDAEFRRSKGVYALTKAYEGLFGVVAKVNEEDANAGGGGAGGGKLNALQERTKAIQNQTKAYIILRNAKIDEATATELANDAEIASLVIANSKGASLKKIISLVNEYKAAVKGQADAELQYMEKPNLFKKQLEQYQAQAKLREKLIDVQFASRIKAENDALKTQEENLQKVNDQIEKITDSQIKPIQAIIDANNFALESISLQEDAINARYDKQIESLDKIASLNQDIANIQKQRLSIADALTRGDISTAAQLAQEARAENASSAITNQKDALTLTRDAQIKALGRVELERQNKELQLQISTIERGMLLTLQQKKDTIESTINSINRNIQALNSQADALKNTALYAGKTKTEIDDMAELIDAAKAAGIEFDDVLLSQAGSAASLAKALGDAVTNQKALASLSGLASGAKTAVATGTSAGTKTIFTSAVGQNKITTPFDIGAGSAIKRTFGGMVPKYMARGGKIGSDTVPAMLTPGEFVMNKKATQQFGPLLSMLNESKYPSMINNRTSAQVPVNAIATSMNDNSTAVYNYSLGFNINGSNSNPNDIARAVMREIKNVDSQRIRGQRV